MTPFKDLDVILHWSDQAQDSLNDYDLQSLEAKKGESQADFDIRMIGVKNLALQPTRERRRKQEMGQSLLSRVGRSSVRGRSPGRAAKQE